MSVSPTRGNSMTVEAVPATVIASTVPYMWYCPTGFINQEKDLPRE